MALYQEVRPSSPEEMAGNDEARALLSGFIKDPKRSHAYLFYGPSGCGKTTAALAFARGIGAEADQVRIYNTGNTRGIDTVREIIGVLDAPPFASPVVFILDEVHALTSDAQNALLKPLEDTPEWVYFVLCTTDPGKLLPAVKTRVTQIAWNPLTPEEMYLLLRTVRSERGLTASRNTLEAIVSSAEGSPRKALVLLEGACRIEGEEARVAYIREAGSVDESAEVIELLRMVAGKGTWKQIARALDALSEKKEDPERIRRAALSYLSKVLLSGSVHPSIISEMMREFSEPTYNTGFAGLINQCFRAQSKRVIGRRQEE